MSISLSQAAKKYKISKSTLSQSIKSGRLSASKKPNSSYVIDESEILRVFGEHLSERSKRPDANPEENPQNANALEIKLKAEQEKVRMLEERLQEMKENRDEIREDRNAWRTQARSLIEDKTERPGALGRLFGKRK